MSNFEKPATFADRVALLVDFVGRDFLRLARELKDLQESLPEAFVDIAKEAGIARRKAFALARIAKIFADLDVPDSRLNKIGWSKIHKISSHLDESNAHQLLDAAETLTAYQLNAFLRGEEIIKNGRVVAFYMSKKDHARLHDILLAYGAKPTANGGLIDKEEALMHLLDQLQPPV